MSQEEEGRVCKEGRCEKEVGWGDEEWRGKTEEGRMRQGEDEG